MAGWSSCFCSGGAGRQEGRKDCLRAQEESQGQAESPALWKPKDGGANKTVAESTVLKPGVRD